MTPTPPPADAKLLPCPWCLHDAFVAVHEVPNPSYGGTWWRVGCKGCGVSFPLNFQKDAAVREWNTRATPPAASGEGGVNAILAERPMGDPNNEDEWNWNSGYNAAIEECRELVRGNIEQEMRENAAIRAEVERLRGERDEHQSYRKRHERQIEDMIARSRADAHDLHIARTDRDRLAAELAAMTKERDEARKEWAAATADCAKYQGRFDASAHLLLKARAELAAVRAGAVTEEQVEVAVKTYYNRMTGAQAKCLAQNIELDDERNQRIHKACMRAALVAALARGGEG